MTAKQVYSSSFVNHIHQIVEESSQAIIVINGDTSIIDTSSFSNLLLDQDTFRSTKGERLFSKLWFAKLFPIISSADHALILSYSQFSYIIKYLSYDFFIERAIILDDNLRRVFPLRKSDFITDTQEVDDNIIELPVYQAEQFQDNGRCYCSVKAPSSETGRIISVFTCQSDIQFSKAESNAVFIDPFSDSNELDILIDDILSGRNKSTSFYIKHYGKQPLNAADDEKLKNVNGFFSKFGTKLLFVEEDALVETFVPSEPLNALLRHYWGSGAEFRKIRLYRNPNINNETVDVSQGKIVQTLIDEYENVKQGRDYRDVFLTAPTGAGKSLLFQLPAFYISRRGDVTIVISPLIALMKDQVNALINDRGFGKAAYINSEISLLDRDAIIDKCKAGEIDIIYMAPELLMSYDISYFIGDRRIGLVVIDEAHLITTWGRDFRVDYWYLGNQIRKIRKYSRQSFPMIAVTATAVFGGDKNDMVFDTVDSLVMHSPHYFIGVVKRDNISFLINNYETPEKGFDTAKLKQTAKFIKEINEVGLKTLVYAPYTEHVRRIISLANEQEEVAVQYYGSNLDAISKDQAVQKFRSNDKHVMVCTKAFGMGVDIPDIQVIYHHAPSGLLPDYVQEIGRAARKEGIDGYAVIDYSQKDQKYSKQLYGMSSMKIWQLRRVLKKLYETYLNNKMKRNMLLSTDDFAFTFEDANDIEQKVKTALMMIEKDYLIKYRFNVIIARPKQLFTKVYARLSSEAFKALDTEYPSSFKVISRHSGGSSICLIDLNDLWMKHFSEVSFPILKHKYYTGTLFHGYDVQPRICLSYVFTNKKETMAQIKKALEILTKFFVSTNYKAFDKDMLTETLKVHYSDRTARLLAAFVLSTYSGEQKNFKGGIEENAFLLEIHNMRHQYKVFGNRYEGSFASTISLLAKLIETNENKATRFSSRENALPYIRIGHLLEILELGSFEIRGGEAPMIFIRINSPERVKKDSMNPGYTNILFEKTQEKHVVSTEIMNYFFTHSYTDEERWNFIEDFFLGDNNEELIRKYPGKETVKMDLIGELKSKERYQAATTQKADVVQSSLTFPPRDGKYMPKDHLTIEIGRKNITKTIQEWIDTDPLSLHKLVQDNTIYVDSEFVYLRLMKVLESNYPEYYTKFKGLKKLIKISGYDEPVTASVVMASDPLKFYKWWRLNMEQVYIPLKDKIWLFDKVYEIDKKQLRVSDKKLIGK